ncbi:general transcription factor 3C polypeptide 2-like [Myxocyprinus asiaticus]|uniref:general transcription factor 3C polypeptide 2-like n=1 Tax=Myxocyprinus asiaticus TaxID=70543 RepID=UPI002222EF32|nr:general transcription factor 3C polypeptide 2-like [Myxocyprinus asiaticus]
MASAALKLAEQRGESMGLPYEKDEEEHMGLAIHENKEVTHDLGKELLSSSEPQKMESELQKSGCDLPDKGVKPETNSDMTSATLEKSQELPQGQTHTSQVPRDVCQESSLNKEAVQKKLGRPNASPRVEKTPAKRRKKEIIPQIPPQHENSTTLDTSELTASGRPKRRAAKAALDYLHNLAKDLSHTESSTKDTHKHNEVDSKSKKKDTARGKGTKRKVPGYNSDIDDEDFTPEKDDEAESEDDEDDEDSEPGMALSWSLDMERRNRQSKGRFPCMLPNGLTNNVMEHVWNCFRRTKEFHDENFSPWVFPEWIPSAKDWHFLTYSEAEKYLPQEKTSAAFTFTRENIKGKIELQRMNRFESLPHHTSRWDSLFFVGGPVRSMEWCPCPDGAAGTKYAAIYCHKGMDDRHKINQLHTGPVLLQLWDFGSLQCKSRPSTAPHLAYALAIDDGCIWNIKWCPAGVWEQPSTSRKTLQMARLGLLAAAFSNGTIRVYSLPHPEALTAHHLTKGGPSQALLICRVKPVLTLKMGSSQADHKGQSGMCFAMDWLYVKPHNLLAAGFYDGVVGLWDLASKSPLLKVKSSDGFFFLYPYHCFLAHDESIRTLCWCRASSNLLVTVGDDRMAKMWDLRKTYVPLFAVKRCLSPEVYWPLFWSGIFIAQECCYATFGQHGVHYFDSGYLGIRPFFVCPRRATLWSLSMSDWINAVAVGDNSGDCLFSLIPQMNSDPSSMRRRRFSVYRTDQVQFQPGQRPGDEKEEEEEEGESVTSIPGQEPRSYKGAIKKYYLHFHDMDLGNFAKCDERPMTKHMQQAENKGDIKVEQMPLSALYKVRFNPNMDAYTWVLSGGQSGLVRVHCIRGLSGSLMLKQLREAQAQFSAMFQSQEPEDSVTAVRHRTADTVQVH